VTETATRAIRLLIVDRSPAARERLRQVFDKAADISVVEEASTADKALQAFEIASPTIVLVDCDLPKPGSFAAVKEMMRLYPTPVVMLSKQPKEAVPDLETQVLATGAVALAVWTPGERGKSDEDLVRTVRAMSEVKVVRRRESHLRTSPPAAETPSPSIPPAATGRVEAAPGRASGTTARRSGATSVRLDPPTSRIEIVAIGASTGGPPVLQSILSSLRQPFPVPIVLVQHLSRGFQKSLVAWLQDSTGMRIRIGEHYMPLEPGIVYLAPDDRHMTIDASGRLLLNDDPPENASRPSVSVLFRSVAQRYGAKSIGILLTGMGRDGAKELRQMRDRGAVTIAQDEETSVVHGMPGEAIKLKGARYILPPERIPSVVEHHVGWSPVHGEPGALPLVAK
jgi:two-component system chemotaxis response regulator CheB